MPAVNLRLIPGKLMYFALFGGYATTLPFLPLYFLSIGISKENLGFLAALMPFTSVVGGPLFGGLSDGLNAPRVVMIALVLFYALNRLLFLVGRLHEFWFVFFIMLFGEAAGGSIPALVDSSVLVSLGEHTELFGKQRLWGAVGWGSMAPIAGYIFSEYDMNVNFLLHTGFMVLGIFCAAFMKNPPVKREGTLLQGLKNVTSAGYPVAVFFFAVFLMGTAFGLLSNFLFVFMEELGASKALMGATLTVTCVAEIPLFFFSDKIIKRMGCETVILVAMFCMIIRLGAISLQKIPELILPIEILHGVTFGLMYAAATEYTTKIAPPGMTATLQGVFNGVYTGLGSGVGCIVGGYLYATVGLRNTFRLECGVILIALVSFWASMKLQKKSKTVSLEQDQDDELGSGSVELIQVQIEE